MATTGAGDASTFWGATAQLPARASSSERLVAPDTAVRARLNAIVIDRLVLGLLTRSTLAILGISLVSINALALVVGLEFLYFFAHEARNGQTIGKRIAHVRVTGLDGSRITVRRAAIRNALRIVDALPILYASGLISLMRTGRTRRQRIGDIVAGTTVVIDSHGSPLRTPRWLLPVTTAAAVLGSILVLVAIDHAQAPAGNAVGFSEATAQAPVIGEWLATGTTTSSVGYAGKGAGEQLTRRWWITRRCVASGCHFLVTRELAGEPPTTAELIARSDGWQAHFPARQYGCAVVGNSQVYWSQQSTFVFRFSSGGRLAEAHEGTSSYAPSCGYGAATTDWTAVHR